MKKLLLLLPLVLFFGAPVFAQVQYGSAVISFPHIDVGGDPAGLNYVTLVQLVNNNSADISGHLTLFSDSGAALSASFDGQPAVAALDFTIPSGATKQIQISLSGAITSGWIQVGFTPANAQTTVIIQYRAGTSVLSEVGVNEMDEVDSNSCAWVCGTDFSGESDTANGLNTGIAIVNPNSTANGALVRLWDPNTGSQLGSTTLALAANAHVAKLLTELFPSVAGINLIRAQVSIDSCSTSACTAAGTGGFITTALRLNGSLFTTLPVVPRGTTTSVLRFLPHIAFGGDPNGVNFKTALYLTTPVTAGVTGVADIFDDNGNPIAASANGGTPSSHFAFTLLGSRVMKIVLSGDATLRAGWVQLTLPGNAALVVNAVFQTYTGATLASEASVLESPADTEALISVNVLSGVTNVGVALANPQATSNTISLTLYNQAGFVAQTQFVTLPPFGHLAQYVTTIFPQLASAPSFSGSLSIQSGMAFSAVALRQNGSNVVGFAALPVSDSVMFLPSVTNMQITSTNRTTGQVNFTISVTDFSADVVTSTSTAVQAAVGVNYTSGANQGFDGYYSLLLDGTSMVGAVSGSLSGTFQGQLTNIPSGTAGSLYVAVEDSLGNFSNLIILPFKF
jgi:hypothetical protein